MDFINKIGQRNVSKILFAISIFFSIIGYVAKYFNDINAGIEVPLSVIMIKSLLGTILLSSSIGILSVAAHKTKDYRVATLFMSLFLLIINLLLFYLKVNLLYLTLGEIILSLIFLFIVIKQEFDRKLDEKRNKRKIKIVQNKLENQ